MIKAAWSSNPWFRDSVSYTFIRALGGDSSDLTLSVRGVQMPQP